MVGAPAGERRAAQWRVDELERIKLRADKGEDGLWTAGPAHLPQGGTWEVVAAILITDFGKELIGGRDNLAAMTVTK